MPSGSERRRRATFVQCRVSAAEKDEIAERAQSNGYATVGDYLRAMALGDGAALRRSRSLDVPMTADERAAVGRKAHDSGFTDVGAYARERLLDRDLEGMTISRAIMELRRVTGLQKHLFNNDQLRSREYAELLFKIGDALEAVCAAAQRRSGSTRRASRSA
jgi:hypothetical protein